MVPAAPSLVTWSHPFDLSWQTKRISWSAFVGSQSRIVHPAAAVKSEMPDWVPAYTASAQRRVSRIGRPSVIINHNDREGDPLTRWTVPEPFPVPMFQLHCPKQGLFQSLAAWAAKGRSVAAMRRGLKTMMSSRLVK